MTVSFPRPVIGQVIFYSYLWKREAELGREEGVKDRPCAIVLVVEDDDGRDMVTVLPISHSPTSVEEFGIELPAATKLRLGLDSERSWIVVSEANRFAWPGPDLRPAVSGSPDTILLGRLPRPLYEQARKAFIKLLKNRHLGVINRSE